MQAVDDYRDHGVRSLNVLHDARIASLKARGNENLTLVARGAETRTVNGTALDAYDYDYQRNMKALAAKLADAGRLADDDTGRKPVAAAAGDMTEWQKRHRAARAADENGAYQQALRKVIGDEGATVECFDGVDARLAEALEHERREFARAAGDGLDAMTGLPVGAGVLAVLGAAGAVLGIGRRLSEYR
ncbi:Secreted protein OS=Streptomyces fumanus OX=67302 GN=GCM10018772_04410 PE=4 SV=1 [Streptomyces fumanus]